MIPSKLTTPRTAVMLKSRCIAFRATPVPKVHNAREPMSIIAVLTFLKCQSRIKNMMTTAQASAEITRGICSKTTSVSPPNVTSTFSSFSHSFMREPCFIIRSFALISG